MPEIEVLTAQRVVTTAGTQEQIKETPENVDEKVISIVIRAHATNTGNIYVANQANRANASTVGYILAAGETLLLDVHDFLDAWLNLARIWIDSDVDGEGISYTAFRVVS